MASFGSILAEGLKRARFGRRPAQPKRDTNPFPNYAPMGQGHTGSRLVWKATPRNLRYFAQTPYARRAINAIKNPIVELDWEIVPAPGVKESRELQRQAEIATYCLKNPNADDAWRSLAEQVIEDILVGAGAIETQMSGDPLRPLWLYAADGLSIQVYPGWSGKPDEARYAQSVGYGAYTGGGIRIDLRDDELIYIRPNPTTASPFGLGPLEVAFTSIARQLGVGEFAGNLTSNARPGIMLDLGEGTDEKTVAAFRNYWTAEVEGQGKVPITGTKGSNVHRLYPEGDSALYLKYQDFLKSEIATAFDLSPQNLGIERDVNRSTGEVAQERDWDQAIKPRAKELAAYLTRHALHRRLGFWQLEFRFIGLDREDEKRTAEVYAIEYKANAITPDEYRETRGRPPLNTPFSNLTSTEAEIARAAATGSKRVLDPAVPDDKPALRRDAADQTKD
ncbi:MAG TPA: phage portal protein [Novosphingobium capsulatum]|nr:phage portal protein [Novosphingobium capsulatum]